MAKRLLLGAALALACIGGAQAQEDAWNVEFANVMGRITYWTEDTQLFVSAVPEPAHGAMLLAGLALLRLRQRQARTG